MVEKAYSKPDIYEHVSNVLAELFEIERAEITPESNLYEDLDIDSIDAVDLIVELKQWTGKKIQPEDFKTVRTVQDIVDSIADLITE